MVVSLAILLHVVEFGFHAGKIWFLSAIIDVGNIVGAREFSGMDYIYDSAETFTGLDVGDLKVTGGLRLIATLEPLNGLVLTAWTGAFTSWAMQHYWNEENPKEAASLTIPRRQPA
jgi:hypothetical protein